MILNYSHELASSHTVTQFYTDISFTKIEIPRLSNRHLPVPPYLSLVPIKEPPPKGLALTLGAMLIIYWPIGDSRQPPLRVVLSALANPLISIS